MFLDGQRNSDVFYFQFGVFTTGTYNGQWQTYQKQTLFTYNF